MSTLKTFPTGFLWGAATSAFQVEGSPLADGAGPSNWHRFVHTPGRTVAGDTGDVACDHYHRWPEDIALMRELGLDAYRFSIAWGRVFPEGRGAVNQRGLDFYRRLVDGLVAAGIRPMATLYHWDLPAALDDRGGWLNPEIAHWFADYARVMFEALDDRVPLWATLNEPWVCVDGGYLHGNMAPGHRSWFEAPIAAHNLLRAHAAAVDVYRAFGRNQVGLVVNLEPKYRASDRPEDLAALARADAQMNRHYLDGALLGTYPEELAVVYGPGWKAFPAAEMDAIRRTVDFIGINYYTRHVVCADPSVWPIRAGRVRQPQHAHMTTGWEVYPEGLRDVLTWFKARYGDVPVYVTENGSAFYDPPTAGPDGIDDPLRTAVLHEHLDAVREALDLGVDVRGYFAWSLLDNLEWAEGFRQRFGLVHVDFATQKRTIKRSGRAYAALIEKYRSATAR